MTANPAWVKNLIPPIYSSMRLSYSATLIVSGSVSARWQSVTAAPENATHIRSRRYLLPDKNAPATVSTLAEESHAQAGYTDLLYAVGMAPAKLPRVAAIRQHGVNLHIPLDTPEQATAVVDYASKHNSRFRYLLKLR